MKLWHAAASPFVRKVMIVAHETGQADDIEILAASTTPVKRDEGLAADNPVAKIPAMVLDDGQIIFDSRVICAYLDDRNSGDKLIPASGGERWRAMTLEALGDAIMDAAVISRYEMAVRPEEKRWQGWVDGQMLKVNTALDRLENDWTGVLKGPVTVGTAAIAAALGYLDFRYADFDWRAERPALAGWYEVFSMRESMKATAPAG